MNTSILVSHTELRDAIKAGEKQDLIDQAMAKDLVDGDMESTLPWSEEEELVFHRQHASISHELGVVCKGIASISAVAAITLKLVQMMMGAGHAVRREVEK